VTIGVVRLNVDQYLIPQEQNKTVVILMVCLFYDFKMQKINQIIEKLKCIGGAMGWGICFPVAATTFNLPRKALPFPHNTSLT
jgi:hypothetical protein